MILRKSILGFVLVTLFLSSVQGQEVKRKSSGPRRQLATIVFAGLGGAILGLSTLSFYGRPQDELANIAVGFAVGVIAGTAYVTFKSATTREYYEEPGEKSRDSFLSKPLPTLASRADELYEKNPGSSKVTLSPVFLKVTGELPYGLGGLVRVSF